MPTISALGIGSGLDLNGLLDQLESAEREKLVPIINNKKSFEAKISAYGQLRSSLAQFETAAAKLNKTSLFDTVKSSVTGEALTAAAGSGAQTGTYLVNVTAMANAYSIATTGVADRKENLGAATIAIDLADGTSLSVDLDAENSSLESIRDAINAQEAGVNAAIVNDGGANPYRLTLTSSESGTESAITGIDFGALAGTLDADPVTELLAANASFTVNGLEIASQTNQVKDSIEGLTLSLAEIGESTIRVTTDEDAIRKSVTEFVSAYNKLQETIATMSSYDPDTGDAGTLLGDSTLRSVQSRLRSVFVEGVPGGDLATLTDIGITLQLDGTLKTDDAVLSGVIADDRRALAGFFAADTTEDGLAGKLGTTLKAILRDSGVLDIASDGLDNRIDRLDDRYDRVNLSIDRTVERYRLQFAQLDSLVANMNQTSGYIAQQFDILNAQMSQNR